VNTLERASRDLVEEPLASPTPISTIRTRATQLRRRRAAAFTCLVAMAVLACVGGLGLSRTPRGDNVSTTSPSPATGPIDLGPGTPFIPSTSADGDQTILPITLADGDTITLGYPDQLAIAELGFTPMAAINWHPDGRGDTCCFRALEIRHGTIDQVFAGLEPAKVYPGGNGESVSYFTGTNVNYLAFQIGDWVVTVPDGRDYEAPELAMTEDERAVYAESLSGYETADGFLVLTPVSPLELVSADQPSAAFGDALGLVYRDCAPTTDQAVNVNGFSIEAQSEEAGTWLCYPRIPIVVAAHGSQSFQTQITDGLRVVANHQAGYG